MNIRVEIKQVDKSALINWQSLSISKNITSLIDECGFSILKVIDSYTPTVNDEVEIYTTDDSLVETKVFGGFIIKIGEDLNRVDGGYYKISCQDYSYELTGTLVAKSFNDKTAEFIIKDLVSEFAPAFNTDNVIANKEIKKIVFNQVNVADCLTRISKIIGYEWYVDPNRNLFFFQRFSLSAPFNLTDTGGNYIYKSLKRTIDGSQVANQVKVRGGLGTETSLFQDSITVSGSETLTFKLPYKFSSLQVFVGGVSKRVGIDNIDNFVNADVLYNYQDDSIRFETNLASGSVVLFKGYKKYPVMAVVVDLASVGLIGLREKYIVDSTLENASMARERAKLELDLSSEAISDCNFSTYQHGLEAGMKISISSDMREVSGLDFIITKITFKTRTADEFYYQVSTSTARKMGLTEFLKELATRGDTFSEDDNVSAEKIYYDLADVEIDELIEAVHAQEDYADVEIDELVYNNNVEPRWVYGYYIPTSVSDPKRMGRFNRGAKFQ